MVGIFRGNPRKSKPKNGPQTRLCTVWDMRIDRVVCVIPARKLTSTGSAGHTRMDTTLRTHDEIHDDRTLDLTNLRLKILPTT